MRLKPPFFCLLASALAAFAVRPLAGQADWRRVERPGANVLPLAAYDSQRQRLVVAQPADGGMEVFEFASGRWHHPHPANRPPERRGATLTYDPVRRRTVLFGGSWFRGGDRQDTWEWDGRHWQAAQPVGPLPPVRDEAQAAFDQNLGEVVVFGGRWHDTAAQTHRLRGDLWSWNGLRWTQRGAGGSGQPPARNLHTVFYDARVGELILFGGFVGNNRFVDDTWSWRPAQGWRRLATAGTPGPRGWHRAAFDATRGVAVLFGHYLLWNNSETWEWNGPSRQWTKRSLAPPGGLGREAPALVFDGSQVLLFGGNANYGTGGSGQYGQRSDLFALDSPGNRWVQQSPTQPNPSRWVAATDSRRGTLVAMHASNGSTPMMERHNGVWRAIPELSRPFPMPRRNQSLADTGQGSILLFGGRNDQRGRLQDTWAFDGTRWTPVSTSGPSPRDEAAMAGDGNGTVLLFGGRLTDNPATPNDELWQFRSDSWTRITRQPSALWPPAVRDSAMAFDPTRGNFLLFGGNLVSGQESRQTWLWNGRTWRLANPATSPPGMAGHRLAYHPRLRRTVAVRWDGDTWLWDGADWQHAPACVPFSIGQRPGLAWEPSAGELVAFSGEGRSWLGEWTLDTSPAARFSTFGQGCPTTPEPRLSASGRPVLGSTLVLTTSWTGIRAATYLIGASRTHYQGAPLPLRLDGFGFPDCWLGIAPAIAVGATTITAGRATLSLPLPNDPAAVGSCLHTQAMVATRSTVGLSDAGTLRLGR